MDTVNPLQADRTILKVIEFVVVGTVLKVTVTGTA